MATINLTGDTFDRPYPIVRHAQPLGDTLRGMCRAVKCQECNRSTWKGCGAHVEQVLAHVPPTDRCECKADKPRPKRRTWLSR